MTPVEQVLDRLEAVKRTGGGTWMAKCPAHEDRRPSLSIREGDDGRVLLHDFGQQCSAEAIVSALGLEMVDLFPPNLAGNYSRPKRRAPPRRIAAGDALRLLDQEAWVVLDMARRLRACECSPLTDQEEADLELAWQRIDTIVDGWGLQP